MSHHTQSHQHQPKNKASTVQHPKPTDAAPAAAAKSAAKSAACSGGADECGCLPLVDHIRVRAYELSLARNGGAGDAAGDWCQAERELSGDVTRID